MKSKSEVTSEQLVIITLFLLIFTNNATSIKTICSIYNCPPGSQCKVCNETDLPYCVYSCDIDNGGCDKGVKCIEENITSCSAGECCSPIKINCDECCPAGSERRVCNEAGTILCCEYSCAIDNGGCEEGSHCVEVTNPSSNTSDCCPSVNITCQQNCEGKLDLIFVLDVSISIRGGRKGSNTIGDQNFGNVTTFVNDFIKEIQIGRNDSLVGVILFAKDAVVNFNLLKHTTKSDLMDAINRLVFSKITKPNHKGTNTPHALRLLKTAGQRGGNLRLRYDSNTSKIVIIITDGRANNRPLGSKSRKVDSIDTETAAKQLHESGIYNQIYAVGIQGDDKDINVTQLEVIATDRSLVYNITGFNQQLFKELQQNLTRLVCGQRNCSNEGEVYSQNKMQHCTPTCSNPYPSCSGMIEEGCHCPRGTVLDEIQNKCVRLSKCKCPPKCSHDYCTSELVKSSRRPVPCMRESPTTNETECRDPCKLTYCNACYYSNTTLPSPSGCDDCCEDPYCLACVREWAVCVEEKNRRDNKCEGSKEECETEEGFKCYDYYAGCVN